jgi:aspartate 1-decarboxylase
MLKSKIHRAHITGANVDYEGSVTIDRNLMEAADILPYEQVQVLNVNNGNRLATYAIEGERGSGEICLNGPAARQAVQGDVVVIVTYCQVEDDEARKFTPRLVYVDNKNAITQIKQAVETASY